MSVNSEDVASIAELAKLQLDSAEKEQMKDELTDILEYFTQIEDVDTVGIEPLFNPVTSQKNVWRQDQIEAGNVTAEVLAQAPSTSERYFVVPQTVSSAEESKDE